VLLVIFAETPYKYDPSQPAASASVLFTRTHPTPDIPRQITESAGYSPPQPSRKYLNPLSTQRQQHEGRIPKNDKHMRYI
jgi:hypothetical protein